MAPGASIKGLSVASTTQTKRARAALLCLAAAAAMLLALGAPAWADEAAAPTGATGATPATGTVGQLGADPTVRVAKRRHCVRGRVVLAPKYSGGGGVVLSYLYLNGDLVARRHGAGALTVSLRRLQRGANSYELISEFADGRAASVVGTLRRCGR